MKSAPLPENEAERLQWLDELEILDTLSEPAYDDLTYLAAQICNVPIALVSLIDHDRQWFKSRFGLSARETPREYAFCAHAILDDNLFIVENSDRDARFQDNPLVTGEPHVRFYAGAPLVLRDNIRVGTLCVIDNEPRTISPSQQQALTALARQVVGQLELRLKIRELQALDRAKDDFVSMVNHELRTPLTSISGALGLLRHSVGNQFAADASRMLDIAFRNSERLLCLVNDILDVTRIASGRLTLDRKPLNIAGLAAQALELNKPYIEKCQCRSVLVDKIGALPATIVADEQRLLQVMTNLLSNAAKFTCRGDTIEITLSSTNDAIRFAVTNHGPGIPGDRHQDVFGKFSQITSAENQKLPGTGLGLYICKRLIELHNGTIGFDSIPDQQTTFHFTLPLAAD